MLIQIDTREKEVAISRILAEFNKREIEYIRSKMWVGDYMNYDNPRLVIDRKEDLLEVCGNVTQDHDRFRKELLRAQEKGIHVVILVEHGKDINSLEDIIYWQNPRSVQRVKKDGKWQTVHTKATSGETLYKILSTLQDKYGCEFQFCTKDETGKRIVEILSNDIRRDKEPLFNE